MNKFRACLLVSFVFAVFTLCSAATPVFFQRGDYWSGTFFSILAVVAMVRLMKTLEGR